MKRTIIRLGLACLLIMALPLTGNGADHAGGNGMGQGGMDDTMDDGMEGGLHDEMQDTMQGGMRHDTMESGMHGEMQDETMPGMKHSAMYGDEAMAQMLGTVTVNGVSGTARLNDVAMVMAAAGQTATHHFMIMFQDAASGDHLESGVVAVKITQPDGRELPAQKMMGMQGHFGIDLELTQKGSYSFAVGTKLEDGMTRQFRFEADLM